MMKILVDERVRQYELTFILVANLTSTELKQSFETLSALVKKYQGEVVRQEDWGKKPFAYTIKKGGKRYLEGAYHHWVISLEAKHVNDLERELILLPILIRSLLIKAEDNTVRLTQPLEIGRSEKSRTSRDPSKDEASRRTPKKPSREVKNLENEEIGG